LSSDLAPYAVSASNSKGRWFPEDAPAFRSEFQRDRDRIIHSAAFRRLVYKTQVFVNHEGDLYRTRLTHSLEVAQVARTVARTLRLNEDLAEAISLAHDLGHTPFGHAGQDALNACMRDYGGFEHNLQSLRVVDNLERSHAEFPGLNLTFETREGILKHCSQANARRLGELGERFLKKRQPSLEAQLANLADEIAYNNHDVDDGLRSGLLELEELAEVPIVGSLLETIRSHDPSLHRRQQERDVVRALMGEFANGLIDEARRRIEAEAPVDLEAVRVAAGPLMGFSAELEQSKTELKQYLRRHLYRHARVAEMTERARDIVTRLFELYMGDYGELPEEHAAIARKEHAADGETAAARVVSDYIAGMTDRFAMQAHESLEAR